MGFFYEIWLSVLISLMKVIESLLLLLLLAGSASGQAVRETQVRFRLPALRGLVASKPGEHGVPCNDGRWLRNSGVWV